MCMRQHMKHNPPHISTPTNPPPWTCQGRETMTSAIAPRFIHGTPYLLLRREGRKHIIHRISLALLPVSGALDDGNLLGFCRSRHDGQGVPLVLLVAERAEANDNLDGRRLGH